MPYTLGQISLLREVSVCDETALFNGSVGVAGGGGGAWSYSCTFGTFLLCPLALSMPTYSNFQINGASEEAFI